MIGGMFKKQIAEGETVLAEIDKQLGEAEAKIDPFVTKVAPLLPALATKFVRLVPELNIVTDAEITAAAEAFAAIPALLKQAQQRIEELEAELKSL